MMPFSVLRMWFLGLFSWAILGLGIYLLYEWSQFSQRPEPDVRPEAVPARTSDSPDPDRSHARDRTIGERAVIVEHDHRDGTPYLVWGLILVVLSTCGAVPVLPFLGRPPLSEPHAFQANRHERVQRPDGSELYVEHFGPDTGTTLVFTHGWSLDRTEWRYVQKELSERYHLVLWDLAGLGKSTAPGNGDHSLEKMAADLDAVIRQCTQGPVVLVGHSIGGMIQQTFGRLFLHDLEDRVRGLVFVHTTYTNPVKTAMGSQILSALQKPVLEPLNHLTIWLSPLVRLSNWQSYFNGSLHIASRLTSFAGEQTWGQVDYSSRLAAFASPAVVARGNLAMVKFDEQAILPQITVPTLVVAGAQDRLTKQQASRVISQSIPDARFVLLEPAGHLGLWEQHGHFHAALCAFVSSLSHIPERTIHSTVEVQA